jgi:hypothetical protein
MKRGWKPWGEREPPPTRSAGELERVPGRAGTGMATEQIHLRLVLEREAAQRLTGVLEGDGKRVYSHDTAGGLMSGMCVDVFTLDLQSYTGTVRVCSCDVFERL